MQYLDELNFFQSERGIMDQKEEQLIFRVCLNCGKPFMIESTAGKNGATVQMSA